ncbi:MAG: hypothetical protein K1Y36_28190 [Blastocatellia bacterium]|nr:hypothetical protein [Blastocatellia bacterium]
MFKKLYNQAKIAYQLTPRSPFLIKSGQVPADPTRPDMECVRTFHATLGETVYIPGSSLKGVIRSHCEKILRTVEKRVADQPSSQDRSVKQESSGHETYSGMCYAAKTFGSTTLASRVRFTDAYPIKESKVIVEKRQGVAIDRILGSATGRALFDLECVSAGVFQGEITLRNFTLWQLALIAFSLRDLDDGYMHIGLAKSRGFGHVACELTDLEITTSDRQTTANTVLKGLGALVTDLERTDYGLPSSNADRVDVTGLHLGIQRHFLGTQYRVPKAAQSELFERMVGGAWTQFLETPERRP